MKPLKTLPVAVLVLLTYLCYVAVSMKVKYTNLQCSVYDESFGSFKKCFLKARARDTVSLHLHFQVNQLPLVNITVNSELFQKGNGFRPFMYNTTADFCQFLKSPYRHMFWKIAFDMGKSYTNINHTCPIDHDVIVDGLILNADHFKLIPFPSNDYMVKFQFAVYNQYKVQVKTYFKIFD